MKILIVGAGRHSIYEDALILGLKKLSVETDVFRWWKYFKFRPYKTNYETIWLKLQSFYFKFQNKFIVGPAVFKLNHDLIRKVTKTKPDLIFIYSGTHIFPETIRKLRQNGSIVFGYNNDDPFGRVIPKYVFRYFIKSLPEYDWLFSYRHKNMSDYSNLGFDNNSLLRPYYIEENNFPILELPTKKYCHDVVFIGHFEEDGRDEYIKCLMEDDAIDFHLYGTLWDKSKYYTEIKSNFGEIKSIYEDYNLALNSAKIALCILSKLNNDTYTRRCFEIIAARTFMLSEYTNDLDSMFKEGIEAEYFRDQNEMVDKIRFYLKYNDKRKRIARAGYKKLLQGGHEVKNRAKVIIDRFYDISK